jgi:O-antigen/teichoic acid export membrane protein
MRLSARLQQARSLALADQLLVSAGTFTVTLVAARTLETAAFSTLSLTLLICLLMASVHRAVITQPANVLGATETATASHARLQRSLALNLLLALPAAAVFAVAGALLDLGADMTVLGWLSYAAFSYQDTLRRHGYTVADLRSALLISGLSQGVLFALMALAGALGTIRSTTLLGVMIAGSLVSTVWGLVRFGVRPACGLVQARLAWQEHRPMALWLLLTVATVWGTAQLYHLMGAALGPTAVAFLAAGRNLLNVLGLLTQTVANYTPSRVTLRLQTQGLPGVRQLLRQYALATGLAGAAFLVATMAAAEWVLMLLYGESFRAAAGLLQIMAIGYALSLWGTVFGSFCIGLSDSRSSFHANAAGSLCTLTLGVWATAHHGLYGLAWAMVCSLAIATITQACLLQRRLRQPNLATPHAVHPGVGAP